MSEQFYVLRRRDSGYLVKGSGNFAVPKLYLRKDAVRVCKMKNQEPCHPTDGPVEIVPVTITFGTPLSS